MDNFKIVPTVDNSISGVNMPVEAQACLDIHSSAEYVVKDIHCILSQMITPDASIDEALTVMRLSNKKSTLYVGTETKLLMIANRKCVVRSDLTVADVMSPINKMPVLRKNNVHRACIGDITKTMESLGEAHIQVVDETNKIFGVISSTDISRVLHEPVYINATAHSFKDCFNVMHEHEELI
jgi:CBS domain-containing protein